MQKRNTLFTLIIVSTIILTLTTIGLAQDDKSKRPSPPAQAQCQFPDGKTIKTDYSSPRTHDPKTHQPRKVFGGVVPYGQVWRTGANEATTFVTDTNLTVGGKDVPAGSYTLFTVPDQDKWVLVISKSSRRRNSRASLAGAGEVACPYVGELRLGKSVQWAGQGD